jgi:hypothetical protein
LGRIIQAGFCRNQCTLAGYNQLRTVNVSLRGDGAPAVPALVSLVCERLNPAPLEAELPQKEISDELVRSQGADILQQFHDDSFAAFREAEREAVRKLSKRGWLRWGGHRNPSAREDALAELAHGAQRPHSVLNGLTARLLINPEQRGGKSAEEELAYRCRKISQWRCGY